ncbi:MAG: isoamylase early set domain-containing protein [Gemmatimonadales bacterium]
MTEPLDRMIATLRRQPSVAEGFEAGVMAAVARSRRRRRAVAPALGLVAVAAAAALGLDRRRGRNIEFSLDVPAASRVTLVGDFNDWDRGRTPLVPVGAGRWEARVKLTRGLYRYAYLVDDRRWIADPARPAPADADYGAALSLVTIR